jgi:protein-disulfide isomerase
VGRDLTSAGVPPVGPDDHVRGSVGAAVVLYAELTCVVCQQAWARLAGRPVVLRHFALAAKHPRAVPLATAAEAAGAQGAFWPFVDALLTDPGHTDDPHLWALAERLGLDVGRFDADRRGTPALERVKRQTQDGLRAGVVETPALFAAGDPGQRLDWRAIGSKDS